MDFLKSANWATKICYGIWGIFYDHFGLEQNTKFWLCIKFDGQKDLVLKKVSLKLCECKTKKELQTSAISSFVLFKAFCRKKCLIFKIIYKKYVQQQKRNKQK